MKIVFMGTPEFACPILEMLTQKHQVLMVVTQPDKPVGRKKILTPSPVKILAESLNIPVFQPTSLKSDYQSIIDLKPDFLITAAYGQMLPKALLDVLPALNVHGSLLPKYRGGAPIQYALFDGLKETGVTIMYMAFQMDSGDIIEQEKVSIAENDNYLSLSKKLSLIGAKLLDKVLIDLSKGIIHRTPQKENDVTFAFTLKHHDEHIDFNQTTDIILNRLKGLTPEPGGYALINGHQIKIYQMKKSDIINHAGEPGVILDAKKSFIVSTLDGAVELIEIQVPGKRKMHVKDFLNGQNIIKTGDQFHKGEVSSNG